MMIKIRKIVIVLLFYFIPVNVYAGNADLEISIDYDSILNLYFGDTGQFSITVTNNGPDIAGGDSILEKPVIAGAYLPPDINGVFSLSFNQDINTPQPCDFFISIGEPRPPNPQVFAYEFYFPPIDAGESLTCFGIYRVLFYSGTRTAEWISSSLGDSDPIDANNSQNMVFGVQPTPVPTLSFHILIVLILMVFNIGQYSLNKLNLLQD